MKNKQNKKGFASISLKKRREIAVMGGKASCGGGRPKKLNKYECLGNYCKVYLNGKNESYSLVDKDDLNKVISYGSWSFKNGYAANRRVYLHRFIMQPNKENCIDHFNGNRLDNRKENLKVTTDSSNLFNRKSKGIYWDKFKKRWRATICINYKVKHLGRFRTESEAKEARRKGELKFHGFNPYQNQIA